MNTQLLNYIRSLTKTDKKTLSQKALKTAEEVGELAKVVLPFDNAYATNHRFVEKEKILEEAVDTVLCALSIAYELDFTDEEVEEMIVRKAEKWAMLQSKEQDLKYPLPYEIHVTVDMHDCDDAQTFKHACAETGVKPIVIDLQQQDGSSIMHDVMTSSKHFGDNKSAYIEARRISNELLARGFDVVRSKIETVPWHPAAPKFANEQMPPNCYFESHLAITLPNDTELDRLRKDCEFFNLGLHISRNVFKRTEGGGFVIMATHRAYSGPRASFDVDVYVKTQKLLKLGFTVDKVITEFAVYDTKISHDASWINN